MNLLILTVLLSASPVAYVPTSDATSGDGDTITANVLLTDDIQLVGQSIRAANYDAWESTRYRRSKPFNEFSQAQWQAEIAKGLRAKSDLSELLGSGQLFVVLRGRDVYGRLLGEFWIYRRQSDELIDVAATMRARGHVRR
jgi:endonuclease YncB( thermonuclease family)